MRIRNGLLLALALLLAPAASAHAQADFNATLSGATPKFTWESSGSGAPEPTGVERCSGEPFYCEYVLFKVEDAGDLALTIDSPEGQGFQGVPLICADSPCASFQDVDAYVYKSDATGAPQGETISEGDAEAGEPDCATSFASESCKLKVEPGFYVLEIEFFAAVEAPYSGTAELLGAAAPAAPVTETPAAPPAQGEPQPQPQPQSQPAPQQEPQQAGSAPKAEKKKSAKQRRAACTKKAKKIKNKGKRKKALKRCKKIR